MDDEPAGRRARLLLVLLAVAAAVALVGWIGWVQLDRDRDGPAATVPTTTTTTTAPAAVEPAELIAYGGGEIVVVRSADGERERVLMRHTASFVGVVDVMSITDDHRTLYFDLSKDTCEPGIYRVPVDGTAPPERLLRGYSPSVSPDGTRLAYLTYVGPGCSDPFLVIRSLTDGAELRFGIAGWEFERRPYSPLVWLGNGDLLFASSIPESAGELFVLDPDTARGLREARRLGPPNGVLGGTGWYEPAYRAYDDSVGVLEHCCDRDAGTYDAGGPFLVAIDPSTGAERDRLEPPFKLDRFDYDASGRHLVAGSEDGKLRVRSDRGAFRTIPGTFTLAVW